MLIGELSHQTGVPAHRLRYYESQGLLQPVRSANGYRDYDDHAPVTVTQIRKLLDAGLSTGEIRFLQPCVRGISPELEPCEELLVALRARQGSLDQRIDTLMSSRQALQTLIEATEQSANTRVSSQTCSESPEPASPGQDR